MNDTPQLEALEPVSQLGHAALPLRLDSSLQGVRIRLHGRSITLRGLRRPRGRLAGLLLLLGPGMVAGAAGNDAGGVAMYSQVGAAVGYELLWALLLATVSLGVVQEMAARLGAATGRGLLDLVRERFGVTWAFIAVLALLIGNGAITVSEFLGVGAAMELLGVTRYVAVPIAAALVWYLVVGGTYARTEKLFLVMTLAFLAYPVAAVLAHPDVGAIGRGLLVPSVRADPNWLLLLVGMLGTTLEPYMQVFQQGMVVEKGVARRHYRPERIDTYVGVVFSDAMSAFLIIAVAATLHARGETNIADAAQAARALAPVAGSSATTLFAIGLLGASLLSAAVLPMATAYSVSEALGLPKGVDLDFRRAPGFFGLFTVMIVTGALLSLVPGLPVIQALVGIQVLNGILMPVILAFILLLARDRRLVGDLANTRLENILGWLTWSAVSLLVAVLVGGQVLGLALGIGPFAAR